MALVDGSPGRRSAQRHESLMVEGPEIGKSWREKRDRGGEQQWSEREGRREGGKEAGQGRSGKGGGEAIKSGGEEGLEVIGSGKGRRMKRDSF